MNEHVHDYPVRAETTARPLCVVFPTSADWVPARQASLLALQGALGLKMHDGGLAGDNLLAGVPEKLDAVEFRDREPCWAWARRAYDAALTRQSDLLLVQDDVRASERLWGILRAMRANQPKGVLGLHAAHPGARQLYVEGPVRWYSTLDGYVGTAAHWTHEDLVAYVHWLDHELVPGAVERINEDRMVGYWHMATGRRVLHPVVSPIDHDVTLPSSFPGNDGHRFRRPAVLWTDAEARGDKTDLTNPAAWATSVVHMGRFNQQGAHRLSELMRDKDTAKEAIERAMSEDEACPERYRRWFGAGA